MGLVKIMSMMIMVIIRMMVLMEITRKYERRKKQRWCLSCLNQIDQGSECGSEKRGEWEI